jgi:NADH-ubiquinone oxidoreductase chain 5
LNRKWFFDKFYNEFVVQPFLNFGYHVSYKSIDRGFIEMIGPYGLSKTVLMKSKTLSNLQTGSVYDYSLWTLVGIFLVLLIVEFSTFFLFLVDPGLIVFFFIVLFFCVKK